MMWVSPWLRFRDIRTPSSINIEETVIHIPNSAKITLTEAEYPRNKYPKLWEADDAENPDGAGDGMVWKLPACPPDGSSDTVGLCLSFCAALLNAADWNGPIVYHMDHVHQIDIDKQDARYVLAYDVTNGRRQLEWSSFDARVATMPVPAGGYERPEWFFTSRGSYEFQVHITGDTNLSLEDSINKNPSVNSDVRTYVLHVGAEADLGVEMSVAPANPSPSNDVTITLTASNAGPDTAPGTKVEVALPDGLEYVSHEPTNATFRVSSDVQEPENIRPCDPPTLEPTHIWSLGNLAKDASQSLTITARVADGTRGETLKVKAQICATETLQIKEKGEDGTVTPVTYYVLVPDKVSVNDDTEVTVTMVSSANVDPMFMVTRSVRENSSVGTLVGDPIKVMEPNSGDTLTYTLTGNGSDRFAVNSVAGGAQIVVKQHSAGINYEDASSYKLVLGVSDGLDQAGNPNELVDNTIGVMVNVENVENESLSITLQADRTSQVTNGEVLLTPTLTSSPVPTSQLEFRWDEVNSDDTDSNGQTMEWIGPRSFTYRHPATRHYTVEAMYTDENNREVSDSARVTVSWHYPS